jgi:hypothetical protein
MAFFIQAVCANGLRSLKPAPLGVRNCLQDFALAQGRRSGAGREGDIDDQARPATMCCCQIPPYDGLRASRCETAGSSASSWMWACFVTGVAFLSLALVTGIWVAVTL